MRHLRLFAEQGYHKTTTEQIAAAAEISPATFFRYFPAKERIVLSDDLEPAMLAALAALGDDPQDPDRLDKISQAIDYLGTGFPLAARPPAIAP